MPGAKNTLIANERGATLVIVAASMVMLLGSAAIAIDLGMLYDSRKQAQRVADAAALAGASVFEDDEAGGLTDADLRTRVEARVHEYGRLNTVNGESVRPEQMVPIEIERNRGRVRVTVTRDGIPLWFARIFGRDTGKVAARAAAAVQFSGSVECLRPIGFADLWHEQAGPAGDRFTVVSPNDMSCSLGSTACDFYDPLETGRSMSWRNPGKLGEEQPSKINDIGRQLTFDLNRHTVRATDTERLHRFSYYPLRMDGCSGGNCWRDGLSGEKCARPTASINDEIITEPGVQVGPTDQGFQRAYNADPNARWDTIANVIRGSRYPLGCGGSVPCDGTGSPRVFNVAMMHPGVAVSSSANTSFQIQNLAAFFLESWVASGQVNKFTVRWMEPPKALADNCWQTNSCRSNLRLPLRLVE